MGASFYSKPRQLAGGVFKYLALARVVPLWAVCLCLVIGCKRKPISEDPSEHGKLNEISAKLEAAYGSKPLPIVDESPSLAERLRKWVDFRDCVLRTYLARRRAAAVARDKGLDRPTHHASIGDEAVEECAVQGAVAKERASYCERLEVDFRRDDGLPPLPALRCWDTRARVLGLPQECPVQWLPTGAVGRNVECLAMAHRDDTLCTFADSPERCRALVLGEAELCHAAPANCLPALEYWKELIPRGTTARLFERPDIELAPPPTSINGPENATVKGLKFNLTFLGKQKQGDRFQVQAPLPALGISWPSSSPRAPLGQPPGDNRRGPDVRSEIPADMAIRAAEIAFRSDEASARLAFQPTGLAAGTLPLQPPGPAAPATLVLITTNGQGQRLRCAPTAETRGVVTFRTESARAGGFVNGTVEAETFACDDGSTASLKGDFRVAITDVR